MPITFPSNPSVNQTYAAGGKTWTWSGQRWRVSSTTTFTAANIGIYDEGTLLTNTPVAINFVGNGVTASNVAGTITVNVAASLGAGGASITVSSTAPASPNEGALWLNNNTGDVGVYFGGSWGAITGSGPAGSAGSQGATGATGPAAQGGGGYDMSANSTGYFALPIGTTAQRPATAANGYMRFNSTIGRVEYWETVANVWVTVERSAAQPPITSLGQLNVQYLVVAGGGGGGLCGGGGGGAGGYLFSNVGLTSTTNTNYTVTVGSGGAGSTSRSTTGGNGTNSVFSSAIALGGSGGASWQSAAPTAGGSGGGGCQGTPGGAGSTGQGFSGGNSPANVTGGGGGGATAPGLSYNTTAVGGAGIVNGFSESTTGQLLNGLYYHSGGGGAAQMSSPHTNPNWTGVGGIGGGTNGTLAAHASAAAVNTGGGGGGGGHNGTDWNGGAGGSGFVVLKYPNGYTLVPDPGLTQTTTTSGSFKLTTFTAGTGNIVFATGTVSLEYVIIGGGGGGGGGGYAGGGGAGGYLTNSSFTVPLNISYTITIGAGGSTNLNGFDSVFGTWFTALGGGGGGNAEANGKAGGSGGGAGGTGGPGFSGGAGTAPQGFAGGNSGSTPAVGASGGGGGAGATGSANAGSKAGDGGIGRSSTITGTAVFRAGGGGGGILNNTAGVGGQGGGGNGTTSGNGSAGTVNTGGGGGGTGNGGTLGGTGGSGVIIFKIPNTYTATFSVGITSSLDSANVAGFKIYTVTAGTGTVTFT